MYNRRGLAERVNRYEIPAGSGDPIRYTSTLTYYDHNGKPVEARSPGAPIQRYTYDAKGRQVASSSWAAGVQVTGTESVYDTNDRVTQTIQYERKHDGTGAELDGSNAIKSYRHTWYDVAGRVVAVADYGTNSVSDTYVNGTEPAYNAGSPPSCSPTGPRVTTYEYDEAGRQKAVHNPDCTVTRYEYDGLGRMVLTIENALDPQGGWNPAGERRATAYRFDDRGRLWMIAAALPGHGGSGVKAFADIGWGANDATLQVTELIYGADVTDESGVKSAHNGWVKQVLYPDKLNGQPSTTDTLTFTYTFDGLVRTRVDAKFNVFTHYYDELGRRVETLIDDHFWYTGPQGAAAPPYRLRRIVYGYEPDGKLARVTGYTGTGTSMPIVADNVFSYDTLRNLTRERQGHLVTAGTSAPAVDYDWEFEPLLLPGPAPQQPGLNFDRLVSITYPNQPVVNQRRTVTFNYGNNTDDLDSAMSRVTGLDDSLLGVTVAHYAYAGAQRRIALALGNGVTCSAGILPAGYAGMDRHGRVIDLHYRNVSGDTVHRYQYGYDAMGNREFARVTQWGESVSHDNDRSSLYGYDGLQRLTQHSLGALTSGNSSIDPGDLPLWGETWNLDNLGNWSGDTAAPQASVVRTGNFGGVTVPDVETIHHGVNSSNQITQVVTNAGTPGATTTAVVNDPNGNIVYDGTYIHQYDAWNRLMQVNQPGTAVLDATGRISAGQVGELVARCVYDGVGRLIRKSQLTAPGATTLQIEDYYYDGVRRIQERVQNPVPDSGGKETPGPADGEGEPGEALELDGGTVGVVGGDPTPIGTIWVDREYLYGPDYVDEFVAQVDAHGSPIYMLQDANYDVVGLLNEYGDVLEQYTYEAYGALVQAESLARHLINKVGHQGLFFERYDGEPGQPILVPGAEGLYYNRNRWYDPTLGRFTTRDASATALPLDDGLAQNGTAPNAGLPDPDAQTQYGDGMSLYGYLGSTPTTNKDPTGLDYSDVPPTNSLSEELAALFSGAQIPFFGVLRGFLSIVEDRNLELERFVDRTATGDIDGALADFQVSQVQRWDLLSKSWMRGGAAVAGSSSWELISGILGLPTDFNFGPKMYTVYIGYDAAKKARYVGITGRKLRIREAEHGGEYILVQHVTGLTQKQARAIEQVIIEANPHFDNWRNSIAEGRRWYRAAIDWALKKLRGKRIRFPD